MVKFPVFPDGYVPTDKEIDTTIKELWKCAHESVEARRLISYQSLQIARHKRTLEKLRARCLKSGRDADRKRRDWVEQRLLEHYAERDDARHRQKAADIMYEFHKITIGHYIRLLSTAF